jgi:hypothetical protein
MADIQEIYSILLARGYQEQLFSSLPGKRNTSAMLSLLKK